MTIVVFIRFAACCCGIAANSNHGSGLLLRHLGHR